MTRTLIVLTSHDQLGSTGKQTGAYLSEISHAYWARRFQKDPSAIGRTLSVNGTAFTIIGVAQEGFDGEIVWDRTKPNGQPRRRLDVSRAETLFGFRARTPFRTGLERTIAWYRSRLPSEAPVSMRTWPRRTPNSALPESPFWNSTSPFARC